MRTVPPDFVRVVSLLKRLSPRGWKPWNLHVSASRLRRRFTAIGRSWEMTLHPSPGLLNLWFTLRPPPKFRDWKKVERTAFCSALERKLRTLSFLKAFGFDTGGRTLFSRRIRSYRQIEGTWRKLAALSLETLPQQDIPDSPSVRNALPPLRPALRERIWRALSREVLRHRPGGLRTSHAAFGLIVHQPSAGHRWKICFGIYWHLRAKDVSPPGKFWAALLIWPPSDLSREDQNALQKTGFYSRISRSLRRRKFQGRW